MSVIRVLFLGLGIWSVIIAVGSLQVFGHLNHTDSNPVSLDFRKPLIVLGTMGMFVGTWWFALNRSGRRQTR